MTNTYLTGNPLGSTSPKDLYDNASNFDDFSLSPLPSFTDRFVKRRSTISGMEKAFYDLLLTIGYQDIGDYDADGPLTITLRNQIFSKDGEYWRAGPSLSLPYTTVNNWAIDEPKFVSTGDASLRQALSSALGASMVGFQQPQAGAVTNTIEAILRRSVRLSDFDATAGSGGDDTAAFLEARDTGYYVELDKDKTYQISSQVAYTGNGQGFFVREGWADVRMLTGPGQFDRSDYSGSRFDANACGFYSLNRNGSLFKNIRVTLDSPTAVRTCKALAIRGGKGARVDIEAYGFKECENGIVCIDSITDFEVKTWVHDCGTSNDDLPAIQITGLDMDNVRLTSGGNPVPTQRGRLDVVGERILLSGAALTKYVIQQTDAFNASGSGSIHTGVHGTITGNQVGEVADIFGCGLVLHVQASAVWNDAVKLIHGARNNVITGTVDGTGAGAVVLAGSNNATQTVAFNDVRLTATNVGNMAAFTPTAKAAIRTDGGSATYLPENNYVRVVARQGGNMYYGVRDDAGGKNNVYEYDVDTVQIAEVYSINNLNKIVRIGARNAGYAAGRYYGGGYLNLASTTAQALSANTLYFVPHLVTDGHNFSAAGVYISTSGGGNARFGVYRMERGIPTTLVAQFSEISISGTGANGVSIGSGGGLYLAPGLYALAMIFNNGQTLYSTAPSPAILAEVGSTTPTGVEVVRQAAYSYAVLPSIAPSVTFNNINVPNIWLQG